MSEVSGDGGTRAVPYYCPFCADEDLPTLDAYRDELSRVVPRVVGKAAMDLGFVFCIDDQQYADTLLLASGERTSEEDKAVACKRVHEHRMLVRRRLFVDPAVCPGGTGFADDGEEAHARAIR